MREIKFRAWDKETKQMLLVNSLTLDFHLCDLWNGKPEDEGLCRKWDEVEFMQFTGLHDKNGKEIYEGDILKRHGHPAERMVAGFDDDAFEGGVPNYFGFLYYDEPSDWKVIGNIYENPELLTQV